MTRILIPSGALGLGYDHAALKRGVEAKPDLIAIDGGSTDSGPFYLGKGVSKYARASTKAEWSGLIEARERADVPLVLGTAGTCGTGSMVDWMVDITLEILEETGLRARIAVLKSDQSTDSVCAALADNRISPLHPAPEVSPARIDACTNIVALAGAEQIGAALSTGADIVIAGRATDTAIISALPLMRGDHPGAAWHGAKVGECGALCAATRPQSGVLQLDVDDDGFTVAPLADGAWATPQSVLAHMLYENTDPFVLFEPGGKLDVTDARYEALGDGSVRVVGSKWIPSPAYTVKLEGARLSGHRCLLLALLRDERYVANSDRWCVEIAQRCVERVTEQIGIALERFSIELRQIGRNATLGALESRGADPLEVGVLGIVTAPSPELAQEIGKMLNPFLLHHALTQQEEQPTFAFPFSPAEIPAEPAYEFALNHIMELADPMEAFRLETIRF